MDTVTLLFVYRNASAPRIVTIDRKHLALVLAVSRARHSPSPTRTAISARYTRASARG